VALTSSPAPAAAEHLEASMTLKSGQTVRIKTTVVVEYDVIYFPEAYPGAETVEELVAQERALIDEDSDYLISSLGYARDTKSTGITGTLQEDIPPAAAPWHMRP
jgi:hypothetical protein